MAKTVRSAITAVEKYYPENVVTNADMEKLPASEIATVKPVMTICDGRVVYEA